MRRTTVSATDAYRQYAGLSGGEALLRLLRARLAPVDAEQRSEPNQEDPYDMSDLETFDEDDPGAWVRELDERRPANVDPWAEEAGDESRSEYRVMIRRRARFERAALDAERARRPDFGRSVGDVPTLTRAEHARLWEAAADEPVELDLSWLER